MKKIFSSVFLLLLFLSSRSQRPAPAPTQDSAILIIGGIIHVGNGEVIEDGIITIENGKITAVGSGVIPKVTGDVIVINAQGKQIYPGLIAPNTNLGLNEIELVRATNDYVETGIFNPGVRSLIAYNTDSKVIPTIRSNGILLAQTVPFGGIISGTSSVMQLDAWNWEDAAYLEDDGIHLNWPSYFSFRFENEKASISPNADYEKQVQQIRDYFSQAKSYPLYHRERNINFEAMNDVFNQGKRLFIHCNYVKEILNAVSFAADFGIKMVSVGGRDSYLCAEVLKAENIPVILGDVHSLPGGDDDNINQPFETAGVLKNAGVLYCLSIGGFWQQRNLAFMAGTTVAYGLTKEEALQSISMNAAIILGISDRTGTIEEGKDANLIISTADILDMKTMNIEYAFIQGRMISLDNFQKELNRIYSEKYGIK